MVWKVRLSGYCVTLARRTVSTTSFGLICFILFVGQYLLLPLIDFSFVTFYLYIPFSKLYSKFLKERGGVKSSKALGRFTCHSEQYCVTLARRTVSTTSFGCLVLHPIGKQIAASHLTAQVFRRLRPGRENFSQKVLSPHKN